MARPRLTDEEVAEFRARLTDAAMDLFAEHGYESFSMRRLARKVGCSHATPYRYFSGVDEILAAVRAEGFRRFAAALQAGADPSAAVLDRLRDLGIAYLEFARAQPAAFRVMFEMTGRSPDRFPEVTAPKLSAWAVLEAAVTEAVERGELRHESPEELAYLFWASVHGVAALHLADNLGDGLSADEITRSVTDALIAAHRGELSSPRRRSVE